MHVSKGNCVAFSEKSSIAALEDLASEVESHALDLKFSVIGGASVGKSTFIKRFIYGNGNDSDNEIAAFDSFRKQLSLKTGQHIMVEMSKTPDDEAYDRLYTLFWNQVNGFVFMYDVRKRETFVRATEFFERVISVMDAKPFAALFVGNKSDGSDKDTDKVIQERESLKKEVSLFANEKGIDVIEISALRNVGVSLVIEKLIKAYWVKNGLKKERRTHHVGKRVNFKKKDIALILLAAPVLIPMSLIRK